MATNLPSLIDRAANALGCHQPWFVAVADWFEAAGKSKKLAFETLVPIPVACKMNVSVNGTILDERQAFRNEWGLSWRIPPAQLRRGDNEIYVWIEVDAKCACHFGALSVQHAESLSNQQNAISPRPEGNRQVSLMVRFNRDFRPGTDRWTMDLLEDALKFRIQLEDRIPALEIVAAFPLDGRTVNLEAIWEEIEDALAKKLDELLREQKKASQKRSQELDNEINDLRDYRKIHQNHLREAIRSSDKSTLQEIISKTGPIDLPSAQLRTEKPVRSKGSFAGKFLLLMGLLAVLGYLAWINNWISNETKTTIRNGWNDLVQRIGNAWPDNADDKRLAERIGQRGAKSGDVQISLLWNNKNDLDLHVEAPSKETIYFANKKSKCGGQLDVDDNFSYATAKLQPVENIYWPTGKAPKGRYKVFVHYFANHRLQDCNDPTDFTIRIVLKGEPRSFRGQLREDSKERKILVHEFSID